MAVRMAHGMHVRDAPFDIQRRIRSRAGVRIQRRALPGWAPIGTSPREGRSNPEHHAPLR